MSANNYLLITKKDSIFAIKNVDADGCGEFSIGTATTLEEAIKKANAWMACGNEVEYGLEIRI